MKIRDQSPQRRTTNLVEIIDTRLKIIRNPDVKLTLNRLSSNPIVDNQSAKQHTKIAIERMTIKRTQQQQQQQFAIS